MDDEDMLQRILDKVEDPTNLSLALLQRITGNFSKERKIGQGGFGEVYKGIVGEQIVAVKRIYINKNTIDDELFRREFVSLWKTNQRNVVRFLGFCANTYQKPIEDAGTGEIRLSNVLERLLCFEYISNGSLDKHITDELRGLEWGTRYEIITGICDGLRYLHEEKRIIHMDLKPENILLDHQDGKYMVPKITDFGLSRQNIDSSTVGLCFGTLEYLAPEYKEERKPTPMGDIYNLGLIIIELVTGCKDIPDENNVLRRWRHRWNKPPTQLQYQQLTKCMEIAGRCRAKNPEARPSISKIISFLSESKSTHGQIRPCLDEDDMLRINPLELRLPSELTKDISCLVELTNGTQNCIIAFSIDLPNTQYNANPVRGIVQPGSINVVKITVQARDVREHNYADKLIVQSMRVETNVGLTDKDINESMFEKMSKFVDKVDLMVVYEPVKPQENCKRRGDSNILADDVPEAKKRKFVESAFGKCKNRVDSRENAEDAFSMGISSSEQGQCTKQTEQCKLHTLQCFSRNYRTNMKYLGEESHRVVDVSRGAMGSLLDKLGKLVTGDYALDQSIKKDIESFSEDLRNMHRDLPKLQNVDGAKDFVDEGRELSYHMEDMVDRFLVHVEPDSSNCCFMEITCKGLNLLVNGMPTHHLIDDVIRDIKEKVKALVRRRDKCNFDVKDVLPNATTKGSIDPRMTVYRNKYQLIGIEAQRDALISILEEDGDESEQDLTIVSIVGMGGSGKTTLAKEVYDKLKSYDPKVFVPVGQNPDVRTILEDIMFEVKEDFNAEKLKVGQLIKKLKQFLKTKRYLIVIDDIWETSTWDIIQSAFTDNERGSRVITTTRINSVALHCCNSERKYVYKIKPLNKKDSEELFLRRIFGSQKDFHVTPRKEEISKYILERCSGMPLAINSIASLLAGGKDSTWEYVLKSLGALTEENDIENMKQILDLSYIHLPDHLKTCLLYVCMYPEDREIDKNELLRKWVAEGFVHVRRNSVLDAEDVAEQYLEELINMCMLQPEKIDYNNEVLSCRVHDIILNLVRSKSTKENFIEVIDGSKNVSEQICRVSVHENDKEDSSILAGINKGSLEHVRSVLLYRDSLIPDFLEYKYVRVLHIEYDTYFPDLDLTGISSLFFLRYLKISCSRFSRPELKLPVQIGQLQQLETIDLNGGLKNYPSDIVTLPHLSHLRYSGYQGIMLPYGIERMKSLHTLEGVCLGESSVETVKGLGELTNLRNLVISSYFTTASEEVASACIDALYSSISRLSTSLRILTLKGKFCSRAPFSEWTRNHIKNQDTYLVYIRKLHLSGWRSFGRCPAWIGQLRDLYSLSIKVREVSDGISIVAGLPSLAYLKFSIDTSNGEKEESVVISGGGAFQALKHLVFHCSMASLTFEEGAFPMLEKLQILFRHHTYRKILPDVGIEHLPAPTLKQICLIVSTDDDDVMERHYKAEGSEDWDIYESVEYMTELLRELSRLMERAFKEHHPGAEIHFKYGDSLRDALEDAFAGADDEGAYQVNGSLRTAQARAETFAYMVPFINQVLPSPSSLHMTVPLCSSPNRAEIGRDDLNQAPHELNDEEFSWIDEDFLHFMVSLEVPSISLV